jgi:GlpG protein
MRQIGTLENETSARRFTAYLLTQGIDAHADQGMDQWQIWVRDEDQRDRGREELQQFVENPSDERYRKAESAAEALVRQRTQQHAKARRNVVEMRGRWRRAGAGVRGGRPPVVFALVLLSVAVTILTWFGNSAPRSLGAGIYNQLSFANRAAYLESEDAFVSIKQGQIWRAVTPIFLHLAPMHILFNMLMFYYLGRQVEFIRGPVVLGILILVLALVSNVAQAAVVGPLFGGMSGVVYGLFGYIWMQQRMRPESGFHLEPSTILIIMIWFVLCWVEVIPGIANYAHGGGLAAGMIIGVASANRG